jgi:hypothetical protein
MIVGKAEGPSNIYTALNIGFNLGNSNFDNNRFNTKYDSFSNTDIYPNLYSIYHSPIGSFRLGDKYVFTWYQHIRYLGYFDELNQLKIHLTKKCYLCLRYKL